jgi:hypothetical protein
MTKPGRCFVSLTVFCAVVDCQLLISCVIAIGTGY